MPNKCEQQIQTHISKSMLHTNSHLCINIRHSATRTQVNSHLLSTHNILCPTLDITRHTSTFFFLCFFCFYFFLTFHLHIRPLHTWSPTSSTRLFALGHSFKLLTPHPSLQHLKATRTLGIQVVAVEPQLEVDDVQPDQAENADQEPYPRWSFIGC